MRWSYFPILHLKELLLSFVQEEVGIETDEDFNVTLPLA